MALLFTAPLFYPSSSSSSASASVTHPLCVIARRSSSVNYLQEKKKRNVYVFSLGNTFINKHPKPSVRHMIRAPLVPKSRGAFIVKASSDVDGTESRAPDSPTPKDTDETVPVENLPLESKIKMNLEQKMKMKIAKKIRLKRKRLLRKRLLRKKGRWPPSKLKQNKNV